MYHKPIIFITAGIFAFGTAFNAGAVNICAADNTAVAAHTQRYNNTNRPPEKERLFKSKAVESEIKRIKKLLKNPKLAWMFENCFPNTIDTTVHFRLDENGEPDTFVYTGDIHAMWLRDSGAQVCLQRRSYRRRLDERHYRHEARGA